IVWQKFAAAFGPESLRLVSYSNLRDRKIDVVQHFLGEVINWRKKFEVPKQNIVENISPDPVQTEMLRGLNYLHFLKTGKKDIRIRIGFFKYHDMTKFAALAEIMRAELTQLRLDDNAPMFDQVFDAVSGYKHCLVSPAYGNEIFRRRAK